MRPTFGFVFFYGAWLNSWIVLLIGLFGLSTSWFWFPKPKKVNPTVERFINIEREYLTPPWTLVKVGGLISVISFILLATLMFWYRWVETALFLMCIGGIAKSFWSIKVAGKSGYIAAGFGCFWIALSIAIYMLLVR